MNSTKLISWFENLGFSSSFSLIQLFWSSWVVVHHTLTCKYQFFDLHCTCLTKQLPKELFVLWSDWFVPLWWFDRSAVGRSDKLHGLLQAIYFKTSRPAPKFQLPAIWMKGPACRLCSTHAQLVDHAPIISEIVSFQLVVHKDIT